MRPIRLLLSILLMLVPAVALAHGPSRQKVDMSVDVKAPPAEVWAVIGNFQDMSWLPAVFATKGENGNTPDTATRVLTLGKEGGPEVFETLRKYDAAKMSYSYVITQVDPAVFPVSNYSSTISVAANPDGGSKITWKAGFYRGFPNNNPPENMSDEAALKAVTGLYELGLGALAERFGK